MRCDVLRRSHPILVRDEKMTDAFASHHVKCVTGRPNEFRIAVHYGCTDDAAFDTFVKNVRTSYEAQTDPFILVFDLRKMDFALPDHVLAWIDLFHSVKKTTVRFLIATHICIQSATIKSVVETFLSLYLPTKPLSIHTDWETVRSHLRQKT